MKSKEESQKKASAENVMSVKCEMEEKARSVRGGVKIYKRRISIQWKYLQAAQRRAEYRKRRTRAR